MLGFSEIVYSNYSYLYYCGAVLALRTYTPSVRHPNPYQEHVLPIGVESQYIGSSHPCTDIFPQCLRSLFCLWRPPLVLDPSPCSVSLSLSLCFIFPPLEVLRRLRRLRRSLLVRAKQPVHRLPFAMGLAFCFISTLGSLYSPCHLSDDLRVPVDGPLLSCSCRGGFVVGCGGLVLIFWGC